MIVGSSLVPDLSVAVAAALATFFAPCAYALLPGYVGYTTHRVAGDGTGKLLLRGLVAGGGVLVALGGMVLLIVTVGTYVIPAIEIIEIGVGIAIAAFGVLVLLQRGPTFHVPLPNRPSDLTGFGLFGAGYAIASVGCVLPVFLAVTGIAMTASPSAASAVLGTYVGLVVVLMVAVTIAAGLGAESLLERFRGSTPWVRRIAGVVLILAGIGQVYVALYVPTVGF